MRRNHHATLPCITRQNCRYSVLSLRLELYITSTFLVAGEASVNTMRTARGDDGSGVCDSKDLCVTIM